MQNKKITEIEYANFYAGEAEKYDFNYKGKTYSLTAPDINSNIIFDPLNKKLSATSGTVQQATLKLTEKGLECQKCASINIGDYSLSCTGSCEITLDDKFDLNAAEVRGKGLFLDNKNKIKANGEKFLVCLSGHPIEQFDKVKGCEREGIQNAFWLNKDEKINTNAIKTKGELDYSVGFTGVHANKDSETKFLQRPDLVNDFSITKGKAIVSKDSIKTIVEYKSCQKTTGSAILGFFLLYEESKKTCGTSIKLERIGVPLTVTEDLFIKPSEGGKIYNINPLGNVIGASVKQNQKGEIEVVNTIFGEYDPQSSLVKEHIKAFYGRNFASKAGTSILSSDTIIAELSDLNKKLDPSYLDKLTPTLKEGRIISMYGNKEEAVKGITTRLNKVKRFQKLVEEGYPVEDALEATGLNKENVGLVFKDLINADGTFNYNNVASTVDKIKNSCKKPVIKQLIEVDYNSVACMDDANTIASFYRNKIIAEDYKNIPKSVNKYLTGNPRSDWARLNLALQTMTTLSDKERNDMARTMQLLKDIEAKNLKNSEAKNFIEADTDLQSYIFTEKLFRAPKLLTGDAALGAVLSESVRGAKYLDNIIKTKYFATVEAISEGKAAKSLIKTEDLPEIARACI